MMNRGSGKNDKDKNIYRRVLYYFDIWLSKGTLPTIILLFAVTGVLINAAVSLAKERLDIRRRRKY